MKYISVVSFLLMVAVSVFAGTVSNDLAGISENERLTKAIIIASIISFWVGALWAHVLTSRKMEEEFSLLFELIKKKDSKPLTGFTKAG